MHFLFAQFLCVIVALAADERDHTSHRLRSSLKLTTDEDEVKPGAKGKTVVSDVPRGPSLTEETFERVETGNCIGGSINIEGNPHFVKPDVDNKTNKEQCTAYCSKRSQCAGYIFRPEKGFCTAILIGNEYSSLDIIDTDGEQGVECYRRKVLSPPDQMLGAKYSGSKDAQDEDSGSKDGSNTDYDPFKSTTIPPPPPRPDNLLAKIIFSVIIIGVVLIGFIYFISQTL